eukprot:TRINITY_DN5784_c0_g3_i1.p1 TRINITY_DN5784_c0_g3~~TRINITY_DN5784_c0_g3_i1.p1  ORF type:complete len:538 (+),score=146.82 TRINITY_DN5784_c0_g3_i1:1018-2631(+)
MKTLWNRLQLWRLGGALYHSSRLPGLSAKSLGVASGVGGGLLVLSSSSNNVHADSVVPPASPLTPPAPQRLNYDSAFQFLSTEIPKVREQVVQTNGEWVEQILPRVTVQNRNNGLGCKVKLDVKVVPDASSNDPRSAQMDFFSDSPASAERPSFFSDRKKLMDAIQPFLRGFHGSFFRLEYPGGVMVFEKETFPGSGQPVELRVQIEPIVSVSIVSDVGISWSEMRSFVDLYKFLAFGVSKTFSELEKMGVKVYTSKSDNKLTWDALGGYEKPKEEISNSILLALKHPDIYEAVARKARPSVDTGKTNKIRGVLFEGPPGTGKTTMARILSAETGIPLLYVPVEATLSKWYGESEKLLGQVFEQANKLGECIVFLDEIDSLGSSRDMQYTHEASRKTLSVLLQKIDGFDKDQRRVMVIAATNRKSDLDAALLSRFDLTIKFDVPNLQERIEIFKVHAQHLGDSPVDLRKLAQRAEDLTGRDIRDACCLAERNWASELAQKAEKQSIDLDSISPPPVRFYVDAVERKLQSKKSGAKDV